MRKIATIGEAVIATLAVSICAWGAEKKTAYTFTSGEVQMAVGEQAKPVLDQLGKEKEVKTLTNCANGGKDKVYVYENFDIYTTQNEKKDTIIQTIVLTSAQAATEEGLKLGQKPADVKKAYPDAVEEFGLYTVSLENSRIVIDCGMKNDKVVDISYEYVESKK
ncbi:hypothetical protein [Lachnoclostridium edouardi]|uniref:hypothetical protein n=1 Tax=Lachnoclostridium edouardi TaxID=1926283 RepID=UPI000C7A3F7D|nr:hypothetical protein [Lachnoclostridium edouardi]